WRWTDEVLGGTSSVTISVPSPGTYTINVWMREDGVLYDKLVLTTDGQFTPSGQGPAESDRDDAGSGDLVISNLNVGSSEPYEWFDLALGAEIYIDRTYTYSQPPALVDGE